MDGGLRQYALPATASQVLLLVLPSNDSFPSPASSFLCDSDNLSYDECIRPLGPEHHLQPDRIYFVLPASDLRRRLSAANMAALAVKASAALATPDPPSRKNIKKKKSRTRISPAVLPVNTETDHKRIKDPSAAAAAGISRSPSLRAMKSTKYSSKRARMAVRSFRLKLSTIYEGSVLDSIGCRSSRRHHLNHSSAAIPDWDF